MPKPSWHRNSFSSLCQWFAQCQLWCTPPFQEWLSSMLANKMIEKKIWNYSSKCKWKDEHGAKWEVSKCEIPHCCMSVGKMTHIQKSQANRFVHKGKLEETVCILYNKICKWAPHKSYIKTPTAVTKNASTLYGSWPANAFIKYSVMGRKQESGCRPLKASR